MKCHTIVNYSSAWCSTGHAVVLNVAIIYAARVNRAPCARPGCVQGASGPECIGGLPLNGAHGQLSEPGHCQEARISMLGD